MATGQFNYKVSNDFVDIESICEPYVYSYPQNPGLKYFYSDADSADPSPLEPRFQKAATNTWAQSIRPPFTDNSSAFPNIAKKGTFPTPTAFATVTSGSNLPVYRSDSGITIGSTIYAASSFRDGVIPTYIGAILVGGGGGGGGRGCNKGNKSGWTAKCGGSGGGAGVLSVIIDLTQTSSSHYFQLYIGSGGAGGASGSSDSRPSTGGEGYDGKSTTLQLISPAGYIKASYGGGGFGGVGDGNDGNGGAAGIPGTSGSVAWALDLVATNGSAGNHCQNGGSSAISLSRVFSNVGQSSTTFFSWSSTGYYNGSSGEDYKDAYTAGGCSYGRCGMVSRSAGGQDPGYGGGGGGQANGAGQAGGGGLAIFYY